MNWDLWRSTWPNRCSLDLSLLYISAVVKTFFRSRDRDLDKMNSSALESRDHGLEITTLLFIVLVSGICKLKP